MKTQLLALSMIALLSAGQSAIADTSDNDFTPFDAQAINQVTDNRFTASNSESDMAMPIASYMSNPATEDYYSLDYSHE